MSYGNRWFAGPGYAGPRTFQVPAEWSQFVGRYRSDSPWGGDFRVFVLKGRLMHDGDALEPLGGTIFRLGNEAWQPETAEFLHIFEGKAQVVRVAGADFTRIEVD